MNTSPDLIQHVFDRLANEWRRTRPPSSRSKDLAAVPAYQEIIKMGWPVVPSIIREFAEGRVDHWFWALHEITGANPVREENRGRIAKMAEDWLSWWKDQRT